jgi:hypothetical protein
MKPIGAKKREKTKVRNMGKRKGHKKPNRKRGKGNKS